MTLKMLFIHDIKLIYGRLRDIWIMDAILYLTNSLTLNPMTLCVSYVKLICFASSTSIIVDIIAIVIDPLEKLKAL